MYEARNLIISIGETQEEANKASEMFEELAKKDRVYAELNARKTTGRGDCLYIETTYDDPIKQDNGMDLDYWDIQDKMYEIFEDFSVSVGNETIMETKEKGAKKSGNNF